MTDHFNKLTEAKQERLAMLAEEASEVVQIVCKILRHGMESFHPDAPSLTNKMLLEREIGDLMGIAHEMAMRGDVSIEAIEHFTGAKAKKYMHHQEQDA
jgi:hypothetical protein